MSDCHCLSLLGTALGDYCIPGPDPHHYLPPPLQTIHIHRSGGVWFFSQAVNIKIIKSAASRDIFIHKSELLIALLLSWRLSCVYAPQLSLIIVTSLLTLSHLSHITLIHLIFLSALYPSAQNSKHSLEDIWSRKLCVMISSTFCSEDRRQQFSSERQTSHWKTTEPQ